jgi:hypothetical protein
LADFPTSGFEDGATSQSVKILDGLERFVNGLEGFVDFYMYIFSYRPMSEVWGELLLLLVGLTDSVYLFDSNQPPAEGLCCI